MHGGFEATSLTPASSVAAVTAARRSSASEPAAVREQLARQPFPYPTLRIVRRPPSIFDYAYEDFEVLDYQHHPAIKAPVAV